MRARITANMCFMAFACRTTSPIPFLNRATCLRQESASPKRRASTPPGRHARNCAQTPSSHAGPNRRSDRTSRLKSVCRNRERPLCRIPSGLPGAWLSSSAGLCRGHSIADDIVSWRTSQRSCAIAGAIKSMGTSNSINRDRYCCQGATKSALTGGRLPGLTFSFRALKSISNSTLNSASGSVLPDLSCSRLWTSWRKK